VEGVCKAADDNCGPAKVRRSSARPTGADYLWSRCRVESSRAIQLTVTAAQSAARIKSDKISKGIPTLSEPSPASILAQEGLSGCGATTTVERQSWLIGRVLENGVGSGRRPKLIPRAYSLRSWELLRPQFQDTLELRVHRVGRGSAVNSRMPSSIITVPANRSCHTIQPGRRASQSPK
jgi:hypothetical protein